MSTKYNISSLINKKQFLEKDDEKEKAENKIKTLSTDNNTSESDDLKNKSLNEVFEDLDKIKNEYSSKDKVEAPNELILSSVEVPNKTEEELFELAKNSLSKKYDSDKNNITNSFENKINDIIVEKEKYKIDKEEKDKAIETFYDKAVNETEEQALKRGLARSSIVIEQIAGLNSEKAHELMNTMEELQTKLSNNTKEITRIEQEREEALNNLNIEYAIDLNEQLEKIINDYNKSVQEAINFNNNVEKLKAEYKLDLDKQKLNKQNTITKLEHEYKIDYVTEQIKNAQFEYLKNYFDSLNKDYALDLFLTNKDIKTVLGDNYSKMYKHLTNK